MFKEVPVFTVIIPTLPFKSIETPRMFTHFVNYKFHGILSDFYVPEKKWCVFVT